MATKLYDIDGYHVRLKTKAPRLAVQRSQVRNVHAFEGYTGLELRLSIKRWAVALRRLDNFTAADWREVQNLTRDPAGDPLTLLK